MSQRSGEQKCWRYSALERELAHSRKCEGARVIGPVAIVSVYRAAAQPENDVGEAKSEINVNRGKRGAASSANKMPRNNSNHPRNHIVE